MVVIGSSSRVRVHGGGGCFQSVAGNVISPALGRVAHDRHPLLVVRGCTAIAAKGRGRGLGGFGDNVGKDD